MARAEVIVVDNGSRALPEAVVAGFPGVLLAEEATPGAGPARNRGVALSRAPILAFIDSDCRVDRAWLATILRPFRRGPGPRHPRRRHPAVPGRPGEPDRGRGLRMRLRLPADALHLQEGLFGDRQHGDPAPGVRRGRPVRRHRISEDLDWGRRARALGHLTRWRPDAIVLHPARRTMDALRAKTDRLVSYDFRSDAAGLAGRARWVAKALALAVSPLAEIPRLAAHRPARRLPRPPARLPGPRRHPALPGAADARGAGLRGGARRQHPLEPRRRRRRLSAPRPDPVSLRNPAIASLRRRVDRGCHWVNGHSSYRFRSTR